MKICIDAHLSENRLTGIGRYLNGLIPALVAQGDRHHWVLLTAPDLDESHPLMQLAGGHVTRIPVPLKGPSLAQHRVIPKILKGIGADLYHHPHFDLPLGVSVPAVATVHDLKYLRHPEFFPDRSRLKTAYMGLMLRRTSRIARRIIAVSKFTRGDLAAFAPAAADKIDVVHHGLEPKRDVFQKEPAWTPKNPYILCVAERRPHKNLVTLIQTYGALVNRMAAAPDLVLCGKAYADYREPEAVVQSLGLESRVHFTGYVDDDTMASLYESASLLALPSRYEGFGFPLLEAMRAGVPVAAARTTAIPEIVGDAGLLFDALDVADMAQVMQRLLDDDTLRRRLVTAGQQRVTLFTWDHAALKTLECYEKAFSNTRIS